MVSYERGTHVEVIFRDRVQVLEIGTGHHPAPTTSGKAGDRPASGHVGPPREAVDLESRHLLHQLREIWAVAVLSAPMIFVNFQIMEIVSC